MNKEILFAWVVLAAVWVEQPCHGQNWRAPAFKQPLPQYYPSNRYPLDSPPSTSLDLTKPTFERTPPPKLAAPRPAAAPPRSRDPQPARSNALDSILNAPNDFDSATAQDPKPIPDAVRNRPLADRLPAKKSPAANNGTTKKTKSTQPSPPVITYDLYRDRSRFPIDPRKPCSVCRRPASTCKCGVAHEPCGLGNQGQPYQEKEPGGFACGKNCPDKRPMFSVYWPRPFSAQRSQRHPQRCHCDRCRSRLNDRFDHLIDFKLIDYHRTDNGHWGAGADPYGCLGESKYQNSGM